MPIIGKSGFNYTDRWGVDVGSPAPIQMGSRPPSEADWEAFSPEERAAFGLPDWQTYQKFQQAYEGRSAPGGDIYQEKEQAGRLLLDARPGSWEEARRVLLNAGYDPSPQASGPLFKELEALWNGGEFAAGGHGAMVGGGGRGLDALAAWLPGLGMGMAQQDWLAKGTSSMEGYDPQTHTYWNRRPDGSMEYFDYQGRPLGKPPAGFQAIGGNSGGGPGGYGSFGGGGSLESELAQQAHMDTLMQQFLYQKSAQEYAEAQPLESYYQDVLGDILGVNFDRPQFSPQLQSYFQRGMGGGGGDTRMIPGYGIDFNHPVYTGGVPADHPGSPQQPENRYRLPADDPALQGGDSGVAKMSSDGGGIVRSDVIGDREGPWNSPGNQTPKRDENGNVVPGGNSPVQHDPLNPTQQQQLQDVLNRLGIGGGGGAPAGGFGGAGPIPAAPFPTLDGKGYSLKGGPAMDIADRKTWGLLAPEINREVGDMDNLLKRYQAETPMGGERALGVKDILQQTGGSIQGIRQGMMQNALQGVAGLAGAKKGYNPAGYSGAGGQLLSDATTRRGQDISQSQFGQSQAQQASQFSQQLALQRQNANKSLFGGLLGTIGGLLPNLLSDAYTKEDIHPYERGLDDLDGIELKGWRYKDEFGGEDSVGVIAQQLEEILPEAVEEVAGLKLVRPIHLLTLSLSALKEMKGRMEAIEREVSVKRSAGKKRAS